MKLETDERPPSSFNQPFKMSLGYFNSSKVTLLQLGQREREQREKAEWRRGGKRRCSGDERRKGNEVKGKEHEWKGKERRVVNQNSRKKTNLLFTFSALKLCRFFEASVSHHLSERKEFTCDLPQLH